MYLENLNKEQQKGTTTMEGPVLLLAGAGSGKTRVLTHRVAYLIENGVDPYNILAITFTNKAASEMRERVNDLLGFDKGRVWVSTFHSLCVRILRREIDKLGYDPNFTIYDTDDQKAVIKACLKKLNMDPKQYPEKMLINEISKAKERFISASEYDRNASGQFWKMQIGRVYNAYQEELKKSNALDFDDLLFKTVELFQFNPDVLDMYQERFRYIMVDEYQDTNHIQFLLIKQLARKYRNLCVVGDDDQSIYKFRGANIYNILNFEEEYPEAKVIKLEQNYRSTKNILAAANGVIACNEGRKDKALWTEKPEGEKVKFNLYDSEYDEAKGAVDIIEKGHKAGRTYNNFAILYRTNAQSRTFEEKLLMSNIPYQIVGGQNFYGRREIKDMISYLKVIDNGQDNMSVRRIINVPKRGIGAASVDKVAAYADTYEMGLFEAMCEASNIPGLGKTALKVDGFTNLIMDFRDLVEEGISLTDLYEEVLERTGYWDELVAEQTDEAVGRLNNLEELKNKIATYEESAESPNLSELLEEIALVADIDNVVDADDRVLLMTMHSAKGLEFPVVIIGGMEDRLFPSGMSLDSENADEEIEEERRLCYVGITRAEEELYLTAARQRMVRGSTNCNPVSRFIKEIPEEVLYINPEGSHAIKMQERAFAKAKNDIENIKPSVKSKPYSFEKSAPAVKPSFGKEFKIEPIEVDYTVGDTVSHVKFGTGVVKELVLGTKDYEVTVEFEEAGVKRMFASFAKLKKVE